MASLFKLLFDTLPFAGVEQQILKKKTSIDEVPLTDVAHHVRFITDLYNQMKYLSPPVTEAETSEKGLEKVLSEAGGESDHGLEADPNNPRRNRDIWGVDGQLSVNEFHNVTCQVASDQFRRYKVFEYVYFGNDYQGTFEPEVAVRTASGEYRLRLNDEGCLATFRIKDGVIRDRVHRFWPIPQQNEIAFLHVFAWDINEANGKVVPLNNLASDHADARELQKFREACQRLNNYTADQTRAAEALFQDNLWRPAVPAPILSTVPVPGASPAGAVAAAAVAAAQIQAVNTRVIVTCSLTLHRENNTFTPGRPAWAAKIEPHIMVKCTVPLLEVGAGLKIRRPAQTEIDGATVDPAKRSCGGCSEMNQDIGSILVADRNQEGFDKPLVGNAPYPHWDNMFSYYLPDPAGKGKLRDMPIKVVDRTRKMAKNIDGAITRIGDPVGRIIKLDRQGAFDNIHVAPTMRVPDVDAAMEIIAEHEIDDRAKWGLDDIYMAPICAHDCFHMHWRWTNDVSGSDRSSFGWNGGKPYTQPGYNMVPENQDVYLRIHGPEIFSYYARAFDAPADAWQIFCHHGGAYVVEVRAAPDSLRAGLHIDPENYLQSVPVKFKKGKEGSPLPVVYNMSRWSVFYWNNRYYIKDGEKHERVKIHDLQTILTGEGERGRH
ncbi:MAG: hypothetical protein HOW73_39045 [Polyangiaceae bacterium]|nr:hypothetical protein [Polyangiaceae bacterium]